MRQGRKYRLKAINKVKVAMWLNKYKWLLIGMAIVVIIGLVIVVNNNLFARDVILFN